MHTYAQLVELAKVCAFNARATLDRRTADELWKMAFEYQLRAAQLDNGRLPEILGEPPPRHALKMTRTNMTDQERQIRDLAYAIWEHEGRPEGQAEHHWYMAEAAIAARNNNLNESTVFARPLHEKQTDASLDISRSPYAPPEPGPV